MPKEFFGLFDFRGRLNRPELIRLERNILFVAMPGMVAHVLLLIFGVPAILALLPALVFIPVTVVGAAAGFRRLHDVGRHAHRVHAKRIIFCAGLAVPLIAVIVFPALPEAIAWTLTGLTVAAFVASFFLLDLGFTEWRRGDPGPNRFGPASE